MSRQGLNEQGFTLVELLITMVVLCIGLLGLAGLQIQMIRANTFKGSMATATVIGTSLIEEARSKGVANAASIVTTVDNSFERAFFYGDGDDDGIYDPGDGDLDLNADGSLDRPYGNRYKWTRTLADLPSVGSVKSVTVSVFWTDGRTATNRRQVDFMSVIQ